MNTFSEKNFIVSIASSEFEEYLVGLQKDAVFYVDLDGKLISDDLSLYKIFDDVIGFPDYFGNNWNGFLKQNGELYFKRKPLNGDKFEPIFTNLFK